MNQYLMEWGNLKNVVSEQAVNVKRHLYKQATWRPGQEMLKGNKHFEEKQMFKCPRIIYCITRYNDCICCPMAFQ